MRVLAALALLLCLPGALEAQMFRTVFTAGGPDAAHPLGTVVRIEVETGTGTIRVVDDSLRVHLFDSTGARLEVGDAGEEAAVPERPDAGAAADPGVEVVGDSTALRVGGRTVPLPTPGPGRPWRVREILPAGTGRVWLRACGDPSCPGPERWLILEADPGDAGAPPSFSGIVLPDRFRLEAVRGNLLYGVQGDPGRHLLHVLEMYEEGG